MDMTRKTVMITEASRGIGTEAGRIFTNAGANVVLLARSGDSLRALLWMCSADADEFIGSEISRRDAGIRKRVGLT